MKIELGVPKKSRQLAEIFGEKQKQCVKQNFAECKMKPQIFVFVRERWYGLPILVFPLGKGGTQHLCGVPKGLKNAYITVKRNAFAIAVFGFFCTVIFFLKKI